MPSNAAPAWSERRRAGSSTIAVSLERVAMV
jgi:hypothetical protein